MPKATAAPPYADRVDNDPTIRHVAFADWLTEQTGYEVDLKSVQLAASLTNEFRGSEADQAAKDAAVVAREERRKAKRLESLAVYEARIARANAEAQRLADEAAAKREAILAGRSTRRSPAPAPAAPEPEPAPAPAKKAAPRKAPAKKAAPEATVTPIKAKRPSRARRGTAASAAPVEAPADEF